MLEGTESQLVELVLALGKGRQWPGPAGSSGGPCGPPPRQALYSRCARSYNQCAPRWRFGAVTSSTSLFPGPGSADSKPRAKARTSVMLLILILRYNEEETV